MVAEQSDTNEKQRLVRIIENLTYAPTLKFKVMRGAGGARTKNSKHKNIKMKTKDGKYQHEPTLKFKVMRGAVRVGARCCARQKCKT